MLELITYMIGQLVGSSNFLIVGFNWSHVGHQAWMLVQRAIRS
jgi:hypothetical protein